MKFGKVLTVAALATIAGAAPAFATIHTLGDRNSTATVDDSSAAGMSSWQIDGTNQLFQQWFWYRLAGDNQENALNTLPLMGAQISDTNPFTDNRNDTLGLLYGNTVFTAEVSFQLRGGSAGSGTASIAEQIRLTNHGSSPMAISFFQYSDFDLNGTSGGDSAWINGTDHNLAHQEDTGFSLAETVVTPGPSHWAVGNWPNLLNLLNNGQVDNLGDIDGPVNGDCSWAFQWDFNLGAGESIVISKVKGITPAPGAVALMGLGGLLIGRRRR